MLDEIRDWSAQLEQRLAALEGSEDIDAVARTMARCTAEHPRLCQLMAALSSVLEHNASVEVITDFKFLNGTSDISDTADRVQDVHCGARVARDRDGRFANARNVEHVELPG